MGMAGMTKAAIDRAHSVAAPSHKLWTISCKTDCGSQARLLVGLSSVAQQAVPKLGG